MWVRSPPSLLINIMKYPNPKSYNKHIVTKVDKTIGYVYFLDKDHPLSNKSNKVYYHRHVLSLKIGKWIDSSYHVHHIDGDRRNNDPSNLECISPRHHNYKHNKEDGKIVRTVNNCTCCKIKFIRRSVKPIHRLSVDGM